MVIANTSSLRWAVLRHKKRKIVAEVIGWRIPDDSYGLEPIGEPVFLVGDTIRTAEWPYPGKQRESVTLYKTEQEAEANARSS